MAGLGRSPYRHHAKPGVEVYVDIQNQFVWPGGKCAKFSHGPCDNRDAGSDFDPALNGGGPGSLQLSNSDGGAVNSVLRASIYGDFRHMVRCADRR